MLKRILKFLFYLDIYIYSKDIMKSKYYENSDKVILMYILKEHDTIRSM